MKASFVASVIVCVVISILPVSGFAEDSGCYPTPSDLLAFWSAEGRATDVANVFSGTVEGGTGFSPGVVGEAFDFPGALGSFVSVDPAPVSESFTIEAWIYLTSEVGGYQTVYAGGRGFWLLNRQLVWWQTHNQFVGTSVLSTGAWHHVALTYDDATDTFTGYVDGLPDGTSTYAGASLEGGVWIGNNHTGEAVDGLIDELAVFGRALQPSEIQGIFSAGSAGKCLVFKADFETGDTSRWSIGDI